ncbi:putative non-specific serine/threonine protein kinase [Helianthus anomalus]
MNVFWLYATIILARFFVKAHINPTCNSNDSMVLQHFMNGMESPIPGWTSNSPNCCDWDGVTCAFSGKVIGLKLSRKKLVGSLADSLANLDHLRTLNLSRNLLLKGTPPVSIFQLQYLQVLDLSANEFSGSLPASVNLPSIRLFDISDNNFVGPIPTGLCINSTGIRVLKFGENHFRGEIPPEFANCSFLEHLSLDANYVSGIIPDYLLSLPRLSTLYLQDNELIGQLRNSYPSNLVYLDVSINGLSGELPDFFHTFPNLAYFAAYSNTFDGGLPFSLVNSGSISRLILRNNSFSGSIDLNCSSMINLVFLDLAVNKFSGAIPDNLASCSSLKTIYLDGNKLTGQIPESFKRFNSLSLLSISSLNLKNLSVSLQILQHCQNLTTLVLSSSFVNEEMPSIANLRLKMLKNLLMRRCNLTGTIPRWLDGLTKLKVLDLSSNQLHGQIPPFFGNLQSLGYLNLSTNCLTGGIPKSLTGLTGLRFLNTSLRINLNLPVFKRHGMSGKMVPCSYGIPLRRTLDLSNNSLTGQIWPEFGNLIYVEKLNLKYNKLSGNIPSTLGNLFSIQIMDLSHNNLSGEIPHSLVKLAALSKFSVAYNVLSGTIPSGGQFSTFSNSSFEGNTGLCGEFFTKCDKVQDLMQTSAPKNKKLSITYLVEWVGFGTGFLLSVIVLLVIPTIREFQIEEL